MKVKTSLTMSNRRNRIECFAAHPGTQAAASSLPWFDFLPLTDPPKIKCVGWISGKGV
jgi:hypothetical protein